MSRPRGSGGQAKELTSIEIQRISRYLFGTRFERRDRAIFYLGLGSGMRISEIVGLTVGDVFPFGKVLEEVRLEKHSTKSKRSRTVSLSRQARQYLDEYLKERFGEDEPDAELPLFPSQRNPREAITPNKAARRLSRLFEEAGVANASSHSMRRTFGNTLRRNGIDLKIIQELLGHASIATTERYLGVGDVEKSSAVRDLKF